MTTESEALASILEWSADCPGWQRDALRRLVTQATLESAEIEELLAICKGTRQAIPLEAEHLNDPNSDLGEVYLRQVHGVRHVNALAPDQRLSLHRLGLTIIYGDNGSGKSGYARILKKVCRARIAGRAEEIVSDIYDPSPGTPSATIEYAIGNQNRTCGWQLGQAADGALSAISVFDSRTANVHVDEANDVAYTPFPLKLLSTLAQLCKSIKEKLSAEVIQIKTQTPEAIRTPKCSKDTVVGKLIAQLSPSADPAMIEAQAMLTQTEQDRLAQLAVDLAEDPARVARQLATLKTKVEGIIARLDQLFSSISDDAANNLRRLAIGSETALRAAEAASGALFHDEPLPHIGSDVWRTLWASARAFSNAKAYPEQQFPVTGTDSVCVLCQQELTPVAAARMNRFEAFVRDDSQKRADDARIAYDEALATFKSAVISLAELAHIMTAVRDELRNEDLAIEIRRATVCALWRHRQIKRHHVESTAVFDVPIITYPRQTLLDQIAAEAARRQVIVFTHDLAFLFELTRATNNAQPKPQVAISSISRGADKTGFCHNVPPFKARPVCDITASLSQQLANERYHFDHGNNDEWEKSVKSIAGKLRDTWENAVEEVVGHVLRRLSSKVETRGLVKLTAITVSDCEAMRDGFGRCSELLHSTPAALNHPLPRPEALTAEIDALAAWANSLRQRQDATRLS